MKPFVTQAEKAKADAKRAKPDAIGDALAREPVGATPRKPIPQRDRLDLFIEQRGRCAMCSLKFVLRDMHGDHIIPLELSGKHERSNWQLLCVPCHKIKTAQDRKDIAKAHRRQAKDLGTFPESKFKLRGRGFAPGRNKSFDLSKT